jgi:chromosome partitioning protein
MQTIILAARKGGPGKTTLAAHLAIQAERDGAGPVMLVDLDPQQTLTAWWKDRQAETPILSEVPITRFREELASVRDKPGLIIVDTPGFEADLLTLITAADFVIIPVQPSPNDLRGIATTVDLAKRAQRPFCFVITRGIPRSGLTQQAPLILSQYGAVATTIVFNRVDYAGAMTDGRTVQEIDPKGKAAAEIAQLWAYLNQQINAPTRKEGAE